VGVQPITYQGRLVAGVDAEEILLAPSIAELEDDHPRRRFVLTMAMYARHQLGSDCPYDEPAAERWARALLMPEPAWRPATALSNVELAEAFNVPLDQVVQRRRDLARGGWWQLAPEAVR
jgi:hypothetical protein